MNRYIVVFLLLLSSCSMQKKAAYEFPDAMKPDVQVEFAKVCEKGMILYSINCAKCHNLTIKGKEVIPDFSAEQIKGYEIRVTSREHEESLPETSVNAEELGQIATFLTYKKKSGYPMKKP